MKGTTKGVQLATRKAKGAGGKRDSWPAGLPLGKTRDEVPYPPLALALEGATIEQVSSAVRELEQHPDARAAGLIEQALAGVHSEVRTLSPALSMVVFMVRDALADLVPGMTAEQVLEGLHARLSRTSGGGRPRAQDRHADWSRRVQEKRRVFPTLTAQEVYEEVAADLEREGKASVRWTAIRDAAPLRPRKKPGFGDK